MLVRERAASARRDDADRAWCRPAWTSTSFRPGDRAAARRGARPRLRRIASGPLRGPSRPGEERGPRAARLRRASPARWRRRGCGWSGRARRAKRSGDWPRACPPAIGSTSPACASTRGCVPWYQAADLFLFASETETQGLVLAEAAACGLPAVTVTAPGCDEVVRDGESGILTKGDPASLAEAAIGLLLDDRAPRGDGRAGPRRSPSASSTSSCRSSDLDIYAETLSRRVEAGGRRGVTATREPAPALSERTGPTARGLLAADPRVRTLLQGARDLSGRPPHPARPHQPRRQRRSPHDRDRRALSRAPALARQGGGGGVMPRARASSGSKRRSSERRPPPSAGPASGWRTRWPATAELGARARPRDAIPPAAPRCSPSTKRRAAARRAPA